MTATTKRTVADRIRHLGACRDALEWCGGYTSPAKAWRECEQPEWMLWLLGTLDNSPANSPSRCSYVMIACQCARLTLDNFERAFPADKRPREAIELCERYAAGADISFDELRRAADSAWSAAASAWRAAASAGRAADSAWSAADSAWRAAASAWSAADSAGRAAASAGSAVKKQACDIIRAHYPKPPRMPEAA